MSMTIHILTGRPGPHRQTLSEKIYSAIGHSLQAEKNKCFLIVPEQYTLGAERDLIAQLNLPGLIDVEVLSLKRLGFRVLEETGGITRKTVNDHGRRMLLTKSIRMLKGQLSVYEKSLTNPGFLKQIAAVIDELKENSIDPETF